MKVAVVGCGQLFESSFVPRLLSPQGRERFTVVGVCDPASARRDTLAAQLGASSFADDAGMLAQTDAEIIWVLSPAHLHAEQAIRALEAGKHVYLQKPAATSLADFDRLLAVAEQTGGKVSCAPGQVFYPTIRRIKEAVDSGALGPVFFATAPFMGWGGEEIDWPTSPAWFFAKGNGPLRDHGVYALATLTTLFGRVERVSAMGGIRVEHRLWQGQPFPVTEPDNLALLLDFGGNRFATIHEAWCAGSAETARLRVSGLTGTLETFGGRWDVCPRGFVIRSDSEDEQFRYDLADDPAGALFDDLPNPHVWADVCHLADCVREGREPLASLSWMRHVYAVIDAAVVSIREGRTISLP